MNEPTPNRRPRYRIHNGFRMPLGFPPDGFESGLRYEPTASDVFVCTYPKCGTTWVQYIIYLLMHDAEPLASGVPLGPFFPHLEEVGSEAVAALKSPRLIKTHLPRSMTPWSDAARYIYVARNPFDCAVSFYHHTRGFPQHYDFAGGSFEDFFQCFIEGEVDFGDYFDHLLSWYAPSKERNVLFLTYEALKADTPGGIAAIAAFLGEPALAIARDGSKLEKILAAVSFDSMRRDQARWSSARPRDMPEFVRRGAVGDWQHTFSRSQLKRLVAVFESRTAGTAAASLWPEILAAARLKC